jgi:hypothetical protein
LAFGDGSLSQAWANRVSLCVFGDLRDEVQDRLEDFCGNRGSLSPKLWPVPVSPGSGALSCDGAPLATLNLKDYEDFTEYHGLPIPGAQ